MNLLGSGVRRSKTMTGIVGGGLVLLVALNCRKARPKPGPFFRINQVKVLQSNLDQNTFPLPTWPIREIWSLKSP